MFIRVVFIIFSKILEILHYIYFLLSKNIPKINDELGIMNDKSGIKINLRLYNFCEQRNLLVLWCLFLSINLLAQSHAQPVHSPSDSIWAHRRVIENNITLLKNEGNLLPLRELDRCNIVILEKDNDFSNYCKRYTNIKRVDLIGKEERQKYTTAILPITSELDLQALEVLFVRFKGMDIIGIFFTSPAYLAQFKRLDKFKAIIFIQNDDFHAQDLTSQAIFGAIPFKGKLGEDIAPNFKKGDGIMTESLKRLKYTVPEEVGISSELLKKADSMAIAAIRQRATPSMQILVAKDGKVFYHKSFGHQTYDSTKSASLEDIYDLASVSKISTAIPALMKLTDQQLFSVDKTFADYLPKSKKTNKKDLIFRQVLTHQAGLRAWIPFWQNTLIDKTPPIVGHLGSGSNQKILDTKVFQPTKSKRYPFQVADNLFIQKKYFEKSIVKQILESPVAEKKEYVYSDLSYYLYPAIIKKLTKKEVVIYLDDNFYRPLGASTLTYNPLQKFDKQRIVPTEYDSLFRKQLVHGYVHDEGAAMLGGISTHAGLFGTSNDLAKLLQMYLQKGYYGGKQYISPETLAEFTRCQFCETNPRGIGFDRQRGINAAKSVSEQSYGHSGFTGNLVWIDPANGLLYIFLSNRVYPTRNNNLIADLNVRTNIQEVFYELLKQH
jgi:CubicO group peptidase (beta-lactamase class C family)